MERVFDGRQRSREIESLAGAEFDLVIVGGGINGAGIAHDAASRGLKVLLLEQRDLAFGTSSRSSKLIHGGLRYLEHYQFKLVFEGTNERAVLRKMAPHLVRPLLFALPVYETNRHPLWKIDVGLWMYDGLSLFRTEQRHLTFRSPKRMLEREPLLNPDGLTGGIIYYDCATDDARLVLENAIAAARLGAKVITRARVVDIDGVAEPKGPVVVEARDELTGRFFRVRARGVINATGVWTDRIRRFANVGANVIRPTKGVHIVVPRPRLDVRQAVAMLAPKDGRVMFAIPWNDRTVVGTTDTDDRSDPDAPTVQGSDVAYLIEAANANFPTVRLGPEDIIASWVGLRPLIAPPEQTDSASDVPREHQIFRDGRLFSIAGGKLTTYRRMAAEVVDAAAAGLGLRCEESQTAKIRLPGAEGLGDLEEWPAELHRASGVELPVCRHLVDVYGSRATGVLELVKEEPALAARIVGDRPVILAEVVFAVREELALTVEDVMIRRTSLSLTAEGQGVREAERVADRMATELGWDAATRKARLDEFGHEVELTRVHRRGAP